MAVAITGAHCTPAASCARLSDAAAAMGDWDVDICMRDCAECTDWADGDADGANKLAGGGAAVASGSGCTAASRDDRLLAWGVTAGTGIGSGARPGDDATASVGDGTGCGGGAVSGTAAAIRLANGSCVASGSWVANGSCDAVAAGNDGSLPPLCCVPATAECICMSKSVVPAVATGVPLATEA